MMDRFPAISIIMPTYNRADLIVETIESIRNQTFTDWELLIMDDGSDDDTEAIVSQIKDDRICFYKEARTGQVSKLKNRAIERSRGDLIGFIDSDDLWAPDKLAKQFLVLQQYPDAAFCLTGGYTFINNNEPVGYLYKQREGLKVGNFMAAMFRSELSGFTQALLYRRTCVSDQVCFDETKLFSDPDFILHLASRFTGVLIYEPLFFRRLHEVSDSNEHWKKRNYEWIAVIGSYRVKKQISRTLANEALFKLHINFGEKHLLYKKEGKAVRHFLKAWMHRPLSIIPLKKTARAILNVLT